MNLNCRLHMSVSFTGMRLVITKYYQDFLEKQSCLHAIPRTPGSGSEET